MEKSGQSMDVSRRRKESSTVVDTQRRRIGEIVRIIHGQFPATVAPWRVDQQRSSMAGNSSVSVAAGRKGVWTIS